MNILTARIKSHEEDLRHNGQYYCDLFIDLTIETDYGDAEMSLRIDMEVLADWVIKKGIEKYKDIAMNTVYGPGSGHSRLTEDELIECLTDIFRNRDDQEEIIRLRKRLDMIEGKLKQLEI